LAYYGDPESYKTLENKALDYAVRAVEADKKGLRSLAISNYQKAVEYLIKFIELYPDSPLKQAYLKKVREYRYRIAYLRGMVSGDAGEARIYARDVDKIDSSDGKNSTVGLSRRNVLGISPYKSMITWGDVVGLDDVKKALRRAIVYPTKRPDLFPLGWPRGILLYGPPGCGKTTLAAAISNEIEGYFYPIDASMIMSKWLGEGEKNVASLFRDLREIAKSETPVILFIDEVDSILGIRVQEVGGEVRIRNQFLKEMDGLQDKDNYKLPLFVIASTNKPWALDWGFIRRFQRRIFVPMPDIETRSLLFEYFLKNVRKDHIDYNYLARISNGYTPSDIRDICQLAVLEAVSELFESGNALRPDSKPRPISTKDIEEAIHRIKPSITPEIEAVYKKWADKFSAY
jgi:SpoVK/Ycf46/Vps4 family AAA+-type ATPase